MLHWMRGVALIVVACLLQACGGGGGGGGSPAPALTLSPSSLTANQQAGTSATLTVRATAGDPSIFNGAVYVVIIDSQQVLTPSLNLSQIDDRTFAATIHTAPNLSLGRHQGTLQIHLCRDAQCASEFPGSPIPLPYDFTVTPAPLGATPASSTAATAHQGGNAAQTVTVSVVGPDLDWSATTAATWLQITGGSGHGVGSFTVGYAASNLAVGSYVGKVTVRATDGQSVDVPFTLDVLPTQFVLNSGVPTFTAVNGTTIAPQSLSFALDNNVPAPWSGISSQPWLTITPSTGNTPASLSMQPDPSVGPLASGQHSADVSLSSSGIASKTVTTQLSLIAPTLSASATSLTLGGPKGRDLIGEGSLALSLNTGANAHPWSLSVLPSWLTSSAPSGTVNQSGTTLRFAPQASAVSAGSVSATVTVSAAVNGDAVTLPLTVNLNADQRRLLPSSWGVGLASTPLGAVLSRTLTIADNFGGALAWSAISDSAWLTVTASGNTGGPSTLTLTANPAALPTAALSVARVTIATGTAGVEPAVVRVALWKDTAAPSTTATVSQNYTQIVADRIRSLIYAHAGGTSIDVYNAYTASKVATIPSVAAALGQMSVSPDGSRLYALDTASRSLSVVDLDALAKIDSWSLDQAVDGSISVLPIRPNGVEVVLVGHGRAYAQGRSLGVTGIFGSMTASDDGRKVFAQDSGFSPAGVSAYDIDYSAMSGGVLMVALHASNGFINGASNGQDIAVRGDGSALYTASGFPYQCSRVDPNNLTFIGSLPGGNAYPNNVEVTTDGRTICGSNSISAADFWVHSSAGVLLAPYKVASGQLKRSQLVVTPDGLIVAAQTTDPVLAFVPIGGP